MYDGDYLLHILQGRKEYERRYGNPTGRYPSKNSAKCANCKQRNHSARSCPWPKVSNSGCMDTGKGGWRGEERGEVNFCRFFGSLSMNSEVMFQGSSQTLNVWLCDYDC